MNKKVDKIELSKKYDRIRLPALNFAFQLLYMQGLMIADLSSCPAGSASGRTFRQKVITYTQILEMLLK